MSSTISASVDGADGGSSAVAVEYPESWEEASDIEETMNRLMLKESSNPQEFFTEAGSGVGKSTVSDDVINQVDQFLRDALQNPRERLSVLRLEQDVEKFISDPTQQQLEFQQLPTSYLRLAAHRVA